MSDQKQSTALVTVKANVAGIMLGGINANIPAMVAELTTLGGTLAGEELDNFNNGITTFSERIQSNGGNWSEAFDYSFGSNSAFQQAAKSELLDAAIKGVAIIGNLVQGQVNILKAFL